MSLLEHFLFLSLPYLTLPTTDQHQGRRHILTHRHRHGGWPSKSWHNDCSVISCMFCRRWHFWDCSHGWDRTFTTYLFQTTATLHAIASRHKTPPHTCTLLWVRTVDALETDAFSFPSKLFFIKSTCDSSWPSKTIQNECTSNGSIFLSISHKALSSTVFSSTKW